MTVGFLTACIFPLRTRCPTTCMCTGDLERKTIKNYPEEECPAYPGWQGPPFIPLNETLGETCESEGWITGDDCLGECWYSCSA